MRLFVLSILLCLSLVAGAHAQPEENTQIRISQTDYPDSQHVIQGSHVLIDIVFDGGLNQVGGFDFLIQYDASALSIVAVTEGSIYSDYAWEYFSYRFGPNGNCTGGCSAGKARIVGLADINDGVDGSSTALEEGDTFASLDFLVSNDRNLGCQFAPIRWLWLDCWDNALISRADDTLFISRQVFDYVGSDSSSEETNLRTELTGIADTFPNTFGAPDSCLSIGWNRLTVIREIDFLNGGVSIICPDEIDARGDLNLNGVPNELEDILIFIEFFVKGLNALTSPGDIEETIGHSETNGDGIPLSVADLVYMIRKYLDQDIPYQDLTHNADTVTFRSSESVISSDISLGAAFLVFEGTPEVTYVGSSMDVRTGIVNGNLRVLIYDIGERVLESGAILETDGRLISAQASDYNGSTVFVKFDIQTDVSLQDDQVLPTEFKLDQNYPNPFNPVTTISFSLPEREVVTLEIYNALGRMIRILQNGALSAGQYRITWDGRDDLGVEVASGMYFYRLKTAESVQSKKMMLLK